MLHVLFIAAVSVACVVIAIALLAIVCAVALVNSKDNPFE